MNKVCLKHENLQIGLDYLDLQIDIDYLPSQVAFNYESDNRTIVQ